MDGITIAILIIAVIAIIAAVMLYIALKRETTRLEESNKALEESIIQSQEAVAAKTRFLSQMSHEFRTPMNAIIGLTTLAREHVKDPEKMLEYLSRISSSSTLLMSMVNDVMDMSSFESNTAHIANSPFDLSELLDNIENTYQPLCRNKGLKFSLKKNISEEQLLGDAQRVGQVLNNLISNAYKFTKSGGFVELKVSELSRVRDTVYIRFVVSDNGIGMSDEMKEKLFKPFTQENPVEGHRNGSTGLGMAITKNLVTLMHGIIRVHSVKDGGTTFTLDMPFGVESTKARERATDVSMLNIMTASSDAQVLEYFGMLLSQNGASADMLLFESNGKRVDGGKTAFHKAYDLCIVDELSDAVATARMIHELRETLGEGTQLVLSSGYEAEVAQHVITPEHVDKVITKPILKPVIATILEEKLDEERVMMMDEEESAEFDFSGHRVLLAEDNEINAEIMKELLGYVNMKCDLAEDGLRAVELFRASAPGTYTAVLMDLQMPVMDGFEACKLIRAMSHPQAQTIPIVAQSANTLKDDVAASFAAGMNAHIAKPIISNELYGTLQKCVNGEMINA